MTVAIEVPDETVELIWCRDCGAAVRAGSAVDAADGPVCPACANAACPTNDDTLPQTALESGLPAAVEEASGIEGIEIERELGHGGMGVVYLGRRKSDGAQVGLFIIVKHRTNIQRILKGEENKIF